METPPRKKARVTKCPPAPSKAKKQREKSLEELLESIQYNEIILETISNELIDHEISLMILKYEVEKFINR